jgi:hypothetical protein
MGRSFGGSSQYARNFSVDIGDDVKRAAIAAMGMLD